VTRIIGGTAGGRRLRAPRGPATRPTADRVREALFSTLESTLGSLRGLRVLDVYAGSGAVGLEAVSRGAAAVTLVEQDRAVAELIRSNVRDTGLTDVTVLHLRAERLAATASSGGTFDVAFFDPPYTVSSEDLGVVIADLHAAGWFSPDALLVVERPGRAGWEWPQGVAAVRSRRYGDTMLFYGRVAGAEARGS
jgi:16S rRNA (guanine966-N2)-methyltransferase